MIKFFLLAAVVLASLVSVNPARAEQPFRCGVEGQAVGGGFAVRKWPCWAIRAHYDNQG